MIDTKRLLVIEDDSTTRQLLQSILEMQGYDVTAAPDGPEAISILQKEGLPHLVLMDLGLPTITGFELSERIKKMGDVPIIIISGNNAETVVIEGIRRFADDYITKPFKVGEVLARVDRVLSRMTNYNYAQSPVLTIDTNLAIDFPNNRIVRAGKEIALTPTETSLLSVLVNNKGHIISPDTLIRRVWPNKEVYEDTLRVHMHRLRSKLQPNRQPLYIHTERGAGYMFCVPGDPNS